ncbi:MAG: sugar phosphate isomerase/epimerase [Planctomycetes bacterium]|nr:sugar phosphate isomerase/epimerase [Planctomycetota bacterium]
MKISTSSDLYRHLDLPKACAEIKKAGCEGVDLWASPRMCEHVTPQSSADETRGIASDNGLAIVAVTAYHTLSATEPIDRFLWAIQFASQVGAPCVVTNGVDWKGDRPSFLGHLKPALKLATERSVKIAFENHSSQSFSATQADLLAMAKEVSAPCFGFTIAPPHLVIRGSDVAETIRRLGQRVSFFYAWDHVPGVDDDGQRFIWPPLHPEHHFPGRGRLDFASYLAALRTVDYQGPLNIRTYPGYCSQPWQTERITAELKGSVEYLSGIQ